MEWEILVPLIPPAKEGGHPRTTDMREICNAIYYHLKTGCQWNMLAAGGLSTEFNSLQLLPQMATQGSLEKIKPYTARPSSHKIREINTTNSNSRTQSVGQNWPKKWEVYGFDGYKKVKGRKRQTLVDSLGLLLKVVVSEANAPERVLAAYAKHGAFRGAPGITRKSSSYVGRLRLRRR
jgi:putative transposase